MAESVLSQGSAPPIAFFTKSEEWKASQAVEDKDAESTLPWMPNEIWCRVVQRLDLRKCSYSQLALIWTNLRSVSRLFRDEIENLFQKDILPNMTMNFWLNAEPELQLKHHAATAFEAVFDEALPPLTHVPSPRRRVGFLFSRVDQGDDMVVFCSSGERGGKRYKPIFDENCDKLVQLCDNQLEHGVSHYYTMNVAGVYNDIVIPKIGFNKDKKQIRFAWKPLFSKLFSEERLSVKLHQLALALRNGEVRKGEVSKYKQIISLFPPLRTVDFRPFLRSRRYQNWYNHHCSQLALAIPDPHPDPHSDPPVLSREKAAQGVMDYGLKQYHYRFVARTTSYSMCGSILMSDTETEVDDGADDLSE